MTWTRDMISDAIFIWKRVEGSECKERWGALVVFLRKSEGIHVRGKRPKQSEWTISIDMPNGHPVLAVAKTKGGLKDALRRALYVTGERIDKARIIAAKNARKLEERDASITLALAEL